MIMLSDTERHEEIEDNLMAVHRGGLVCLIEMTAGKTNRFGYFDDYDAAASAALKMDNEGAGAIFMQLNKLHPGCIARAPNRLVSAKLGDSVSDADIIKRQWVLIDVDPIRPTGISADAIEREHAKQVITEVYQSIRQTEPEIILASSGNGYHLLFRPDLAHDVEGHTKTTIDFLAAAFDSEFAAIDRSVHNLSRLTRVYGTTARKGFSTDERPHRRSHMIHSFTGACGS